MTPETDKTTYMENAQGHLVPIENVKEIDKIRDTLVFSMVMDAKERAIEIAQFKTSCHVQIASFVSLAAQDHNLNMGGKKGNVTLHSFDGRYRVVRAKDDRIVFNEGLTIGRQKILACVKKWTEGANKHIAAIVNRAFETDKAGHLSASKVMSLFAYNIDDPEWTEALEAIRSSIQVVDTKSYVRFYERDAQGNYVQIALDGGC
jgi:hypothetical protein